MNDEHDLDEERARNAKQDARVAALKQSNARLAKENERLAHRIAELEGME